jgi:hypothetical protein
VNAAWRSLPWRWATRSLGAVLVVVSAAALLVTVSIRPAGGRAASCGSGWDVVAGRSGWQQWWAQDLADEQGGPLVRTARCPDAVNGHIVLAAALLIAAVLVIAAGEFAERSRAPRTAGPSRRLRRLGTATAALGSALTVAGLTAVALLTADPDASLFLYVSRPVVVLLGVLLLLPAVLLIVLGRGTRLLADQLARVEERHEPS